VEPLRVVLALSANVRLEWSCLTDE